MGPARGLAIRTLAAKANPRCAPPIAGERVSKSRPVDACWNQVRRLVIPLPFQAYRSILGFGGEARRETALPHRLVRLIQSMLASTIICLEARFTIRAHAGTDRALAGQKPTRVGRSPWPDAATKRAERPMPCAG